MPADKPRSTRWTVILLWTSTGLAALMTLLHLIGVVPTHNAAIRAAIGGIIVALWAFIATMVNSGRGWARWLFVILYVLGSVLEIISMLLVPRLFLAMPHLAQAYSVAQFVLLTVAVILTFTKSSREWFKSARALRASAL